MGSAALRNRKLIAAGIVAGVFATASLPAQRRDIEYPVAPFRILEYNGELVFQYDYYGEKQKSDQGSEVTYDNHFFQEYIRYRAMGYSYHPRFLTFRTEIKAGLSQMRLRRNIDPGDEDSTSENDRLIGYDVRLDFFKEHPVSASLFARRDEEPVLGLFTDRFLIETETYGGSVRWNNDYVPMDLNYSHSNLQEMGADSRSESTTDILQYTARHWVNDFSRSELRYRYQDYQQDYSAETPFLDVDREVELRSHDLTFTNNLRLGPTPRTSLNTIARYYKQSGDQELETWSLQERLNWQVEESLRTYFLGSFMRTELPNTRTDTYRGEIGLDHKLFRSLEEHLDVHYRRTEFDDIEEDRYGITGRLAYRKLTALGRLSAGAGMTVDQIDRTGDSGSQQVIDESITINAGFGTFLDNADVIDSSITVTDTNNANIYIEGFDYTVFNVGNLTGIQWVPGGNINPGQTVLVDYTYEFESDFSYIQQDSSFYIRHDFEKYIKGLALYYSFHDLSAHSVSDDMNRQILEFTDHLIGMQYRWRFLTWTEEYREYDSNFDGYSQFTSRLEGNHRLTRGVRAGWNVGYTLTDYEEDFDGESESRFWFVGGRFDGPIKNNGFWAVEAQAQREEGRTEQTTAGLLGRLGWNWRKFRVECGARYNHFEIFDNERDRYHGYVKLTRFLGRGRR